MKPATIIISTLAVVFALMTRIDANTSPFANLQSPDRAAVRTLQIPFIENQGQTHADVRYYAHTFGGTLFITTTGELVLSIPPTRGTGPGKVVIRETLQDANTPIIRQERPSLAQVSYFVGNDPKKWRNDLPTCDAITFGEVYAGVELKLWAYAKTVEKKFHVRPGADPGIIAVKVGGVKKMEIEPDGQLALHTVLETVRFSRPVAYQLINGKRRNVQVSYRLNNDAYGFRVGDYDKSQELVIDPVLATYIGGAGIDYGYAVATGANSVYVAGSSQSTNFPGVASRQETDKNAFVVQLKGDFTSLFRAVYLGGSDEDEATALLVHPTTGEVFVTGSTDSTDFADPDGIGGVAPGRGGDTDAFVARFNGDLTGLDTRYVGGTLPDKAYDIALRPASDPLVDMLYITGVTESSDFPATAGKFQESHSAAIATPDAFVARLPTDLNGLQATYLGGVGSDRAFGIAINTALDNDVYVVGETSYNPNVDLYTGAFPGIDPGDFNGENDAFVARLKTDLTDLRAAAYVGGPRIEFGMAVAVSPSGKNVYLAGGTICEGENLPSYLAGDWLDPGDGADHTCGGGEDAFVARLDAKELTRLSASYIGGRLLDRAYDVDLDLNGATVYVLGRTRSNDLPDTDGALQATANGYDVFIARLNADLDTIDQATYLGGSGIDEVLGHGLSVAGAYLYVAGNTDAEDFPGADSTVVQPKSGGTVDAFVARLNKDLSGETTGPDTDGDGVPDAQEQGPGWRSAPDTNYDGNDNGQADWQEANVVSLDTHDGAHYVTIATRDATLVLNNVGATDPSALAGGGGPTGSDGYPFGCFAFELVGTEPGVNLGRVYVDLFLGADGPKATGYAKYGATPDQASAHWYDFWHDGTLDASSPLYSLGARYESNDNREQNILTLLFEDGKLGDHALSTDGVILDPGGPVVSTLSISADDDKIEQLITKFYNDILDRDPDPEGAAGWKSAILRIASLNIDVKEGLIALAKVFFISVEYGQQNKDNSAYVTDLYQTFLNRTPSPEELNAWMTYLDEGLSRNVVFNNFGFSDEFQLYMANLFGENISLLECNLVNDLYRGLQNRLPDSLGFIGWVEMMQQAMISGEQAVRQLAHEIALGFYQSTEYRIQNKSNQAFLEDLYNGILRRGASKEEFDAWLSKIENEGVTREDVLLEFTNSVEFQLRVQAIIEALGGWADDVQCDDVAAGGSLNILTINTLFSEIANRDQRLADIAKFVADNNVHVILQQEVVTGALVGTDNSAQDLKDILSNVHGLTFNLRTAFEAGFPGLLGTANAVLSRCAVAFSLVRRLSRASEIEIGDLVIELARNVQLIRLNIPEFGDIDVYNTHLCAGCEVSERDEQVDELLEFVNEIESSRPGDDPDILGGDFNFDRFDNDGEEKFLYEKFTNAGFTDAYAEYIITSSGGQETLDTLCEDEDNADAHCTVGVTDLNGPNARRIDYIFTRGFSTVNNSRVVFNTVVNPVEPSVSDHAGVLISIGISQ